MKAQSPRSQQSRQQRRKQASLERTASRRQRGTRLTLETLEDRIVPATVVEQEPNDALALATAYSLTHGPSGFYTSLGTGAIGTTSDTDYWRFEAKAVESGTVDGVGGRASRWKR